MKGHLSIRHQSPVHQKNQPAPAQRQQPAPDHIQHHRDSGIKQYRKIFHHQQFSAACPQRKSLQQRREQTVLTENIPENNAAGCYAQRRNDHHAVMVKIQSERCKNPEPEKGDQKYSCTEKTEFEQRSARYRDFRRPDRRNRIFKRIVTTVHDAAHCAASGAFSGGYF